jgi:flagellar biosynthesis GTPase FlhF
MSTGGWAPDLLEALSREARSRLGGEGSALGRGAEGARVYRGRSVEELIPRIERELGADAIILRRREGLAGGILGFFQHQYVEIEAMPGVPGVDVYDEAEPTPPPSYSPVGETPPAAQPPPAAAAAAASGGGAQPPMPARAPEPLRPVEPRRMPEPWRASEPRRASEPPPPLQPAAAHVPPPVGGPYVTAHLAALARAGAPPPAFTLPPRAAPERRLRPPEPVDFQDLLPRELAPLEPSRRAFEPARPAFEAASPAFEAAAPRPRAEQRTVAPGSHARARAGVQRSLRRFGVSEELALELIEAAVAHTLPLAPRSGLAKAVRLSFAERIPVAEPLPSAGAAIVLVGAGGAGKTTCCATLLEAYRSGSTLSASYATLLRGQTRGELQMLLSPQLMKPTPAGTPRALKALKRARAGGLAVIDTPSVSPADRAAIRELGQLLGELAPERIVVALPVTLGAAAARQLLEALEPLGAHALALTHADETDQIGVAIEAACRFGLAPEYMLDRGRSAPWRLSRIEPSGLAARLLQ